MKKRRQLRPGITIIELDSRKDGRPELRYDVLVPTGIVNGKRTHERKRFEYAHLATAWQDDTRAKVKKGLHVHKDKLTVEQAVADWLASKHGIKASTLRGYKVWLQPLRQELGAVELQKLTKADLDKLVGRLRTGDVPKHGTWTPRSINGLLGLVSALLEDKLKQGEVVRNVGKLVNRLAADQREMKTLSEAEMFKILDHEHPNRHLWALALYGLRRGEIAGLRWEQVNFAKKTITISENRVAVGRQLVTGTPKSARSRRVLPLPDEVVDLLHDAFERIESAYVAADERGNQMHPNLLTFRWGRMLDELGIERVRLHDARHSCATLMHMRGVPIAVIAAWMGHASAAFTLSYYTHSQEDALMEASRSFRL